jgi:hypothetical protein
MAASDMTSSGGWAMELKLYLQSLGSISRLFAAGWRWQVTVVLVEVRRPALEAVHKRIAPLAQRGEWGRPWS